MAGTDRGGADRDGGLPWTRRQSRRGFATRSTGLAGGASVAVAAGSDGAAGDVDAVRAGTGGAGVLYQRTARRGDGAAADGGRRGGLGGGGDGGGRALGAGAARGASRAGRAASQRGWC